MTTPPRISHANGTFHEELPMDSISDMLESIQEFVDENDWAGALQQVAALQAELERRQEEGNA